MNKLNIKTIALDLDGTLLDNEHNIQPKTKKALIKLHNEGVKIILASGRPVLAMLKYAKELELDKNNGIIISNNGAIAYDVANNKLIYETPLSKELVYEVLDYVENKKIYPMINRDEYMYVEDVYNAVVDTGNLGKGRINVIEWEARNGGFLLQEVKSLKNFVDFNINKILTIMEPKYLDDAKAEITEKFKDKLYVAQTSPFFLEYMSLGVSKANALEKLGIKSETLLSFGDSSNDKEMVEYAKYGVAMGNGKEEVKDAAVYVTDDNNNEGIFKALKHFGLI